jgi:hypothetical protein
MYETLTEPVYMLIHALLLTTAAAASPLVEIYDPQQPPKGWVVINQPGNEAAWSCANYAEHDWAVAGKSNKAVGISPYAYSNKIRLAMPDGELIGTNHGEFGGKIEWAGRDATRQVVVPDKNPVAFAVRGDDVFVATGLAHLSSNVGEIIKLNRARGGAWQASTVMDLGHAPTAGFQVDNDVWMVLTTNGITKVNLSKGTKEPIYRNKNWPWLSTNSMQPAGNGWLVGARRAVISVTPSGNGYREEWLVPSSCKTLRKPDCKCKP